MAIIRDDQADIRLSVENKPYFGNFQTYDGGDLTAADVKTRTGGMNKQVAVGGPADRADITISITCDDVVLGFHNELENLISGGARASVSIQYVTGANRTAIPGAHFTRRGVLKSVHLPKMDLNGGGTVGMYEVLISADEQAA